jgi:hypothetical protein
VPAFSVRHERQSDALHSRELKLTSCLLSPCTSGIDRSSSGRFFPVRYGISGLSYSPNLDDFNVFSVSSNMKEEERMIGPEDDEPPFADEMSDGDDSYLAQWDNDPNPYDGTYSED